MWLTKALTKRVKQLEKQAKPKQEEEHLQNLSPQERKERIRYFLDKMTDEEIAAFEKKHGFTVDYIKSILTPAANAVSQHIIGAKLYT